MTSPGRVAVVCVLLVATATVAAIGVGESVGAAADNTTRHENPDERTEEGDLGQVQRWLSGRMGEVLVDCTDGIEVGNYDACDRLDREYPSYLEKYVDVAGRTSDEADDERAETFEQTRNDTAEFAETVRAFRETREEYREARESGDTARARERARRLRELSANASRTGRNLTDGYRDIGNETGQNVTAATAAVNETAANLSGTVEDIERDLFVTTELSATLESTRVSFTDPLVVTGTVASADDSTPSTGAAILLVDGRRVATDVAADGTYRLTHRPTTARVGERNLTIAYEPSAQSPYLPAETFVSPTIEQVEPAVTIDAAPDRVRYGVSVSVTGRVSVDDRDAPDVPVLLRVGGVTVASGTTGPDGEIAFEPPLPAGVSPGDGTLAVAQPQSERALAPAVSTRPLAVESTATALTVDGTIDDQVVVRGRLTTDDGDPVEGQTVVVDRDGSRVTTATTDADGRYRASVDAPGGQAGETVPIRVRFNGAGTNLESSTARTTAALPASGDGELGDWPEWLSFQTVGLGLGVLIILGLGVALLAYRRGWWPGRGEETGDPGPAVGASEDMVAAEEPATARTFERLLDQARTVRGERPERAVEMAYAAVRSRFAAADERAQTHWEFYRATGDGLDEDRRSALEGLTERYERVRFAGVRPSRTDAAGAIEAAATLTAGRTDGGQRD